MNGPSLNPNTNNNGGQQRKLFSDPKINKVLIAVGAVFGLLLIAAIVFCLLPASMFA